jgi:hypothetical protein
LTPAPVHVAFGPGQICLGMLAPASARPPAGFDTYLVGSPGKQHRPVYERVVFKRDGTTESEEIEVAGFEGPDGKLPNAIRDAVERAEMVLITVSMRERVADRAKLILELVDACQPGAEIVFVACDNTLTRAHRDLCAQLTERGVLCPDTIVDRVCSWPGGRTAPKALRVVTHEIAEWIFPAPAPGSSALLARLGQADEVTFVADDEFRAYEDRKLWTMNGAHLALALPARRYGRSDLRLVANNPDMLRPVQRVIEGVAAAMQAEHGMTLDPTWTLDRQRVVAQLPDYARRVLSTFTRGGLESFLDAFAARVGRPAQLAAANGGPVDGFQDLAATLTDMLVRGHHFSDLAAVRHGDVSEQGDCAALAAYRKALDGWMPEDFVDLNERRIEAMLAEQRDVLAYRGRLI